MKNLYEFNGASWSVAIISHTQFTLNGVGMYSMGGMHDMGIHGVGMHGKALHIMGVQCMDMHKDDFP
jgi:hypothetical protein